MLTRLRNVWGKLTASLWFVPSLMALSSLALAALVQTLDAHFDPDPDVVPLLFRGSAEGAGSALGAVAGSMIGVTGVVFSITVVALSLASSQLGPRLLRNFMRDRSNQFVLGTFIGTFIFCLVGLQAVNRDLGAAGVPRITVTVGFALALMSLGVLIYFIHHITLSMQADTVIANVAEELVDAIEEIYPSHLGEPTDEDVEPERPEGDPRAVPAPGAGYLQAIDLDRLMEVARKADVVIFLAIRPGQYVRIGTPMARVWPSIRVPDEVVAAISKTFILGRRRTAEQDVEFLIEQLVETACRALSPGINDPFTAVACVDRLGDVMARLAVKEFPQPARKDEEGAIRVVAKSVTFRGLLDASFDQIRQYGKTSVSVTLRLLDALSGIAWNLGANGPRRAAVVEQANRIWRTSQSVEHEVSDRQAIEARFAHVVGLDRPGRPGAPG